MGPSTPLFYLFLLLSCLAVVIRGQECSATKLCATGCCSQAGFCGTTDAHCGQGCQSTCDYKLGCDKNNPCKDGTCCSRFGFCGLGPDFCSKDNCVATCGAKSYCDPGYGAEWSEIGPCPLRVCCSKWGFCGLTPEFCGDKKVKRPSCNVADVPIRRVVAYYEGWAARRKCMKYQPADIKPGVFTHINFAFASIDPVTFSIIPAEAGDVPLYNEVTALKRLDPNLKVYIAIGGWDFTEPWKSTYRTFSDLAASEANQRAFFQSLISFMNTYNFDGVDIDWEYPVAEDRGGRPADFVNFPNFMRNLKSALSGTSRAGVTLTLPVAYWYLRHFDIIKLQESVEFFNIMSYDLHGTWDEGKNWTQPWLNSHTNLTEITDYLDLLWRNDIDPGKVVLGLGFYSRTFGLANPSCTSPGGACFFHSGGAPGRCSDNVGTLMGAEVKEILDGGGIQPVLDQAAAVKMFTHNGAWITYDDLDTFKLKIKFAQSQCLGGVMVWAVSQDAGQTYTNQLQQATGYKSPGVTFDLTRGQVEGDLDIRLTRPQCRWSNCGEDCGPNYYPVLRTDTDRHSNEEYMMDPTNCRDGQHSTLCCPSYGPYTQCGWYGFWNGGCTGVCDSGFTQVGSLNAACHTRKPQAACCTTNVSPGDGRAITAVALYNDCAWEGGEGQPYCGHGDRPEEQCFRGTKVATSRMGSGGDWCTGGASSPYPESRIFYCCGAQTEVKKWANCYWQKKNPDEKGFCNPRCEPGEVRVAMETYPPGCSSGGLSYCCTPVFKTESDGSSRDESALFKEALGIYMKDPVCRGGVTLQPRDDLVMASNVSRRQTMSRREAESLVVAMMAKIVLYQPRSDIRLALEREFDAAMKQAAVTRSQARGYGELLAGGVHRYASSFKSEDRAQAIGEAMCDTDDFAAVADDTEGFTSSLLQCDQIWETEDEFERDGDDGGDEEQDGLPNRRRRRQRQPLPEHFEPPPAPDENGNWPEVAEDGGVYPYDEIYHELYGRATANPRRYKVNPKKNDASGTYNAFGIQSTGYPNGRDGDDLIQANGDQHRYLIEGKGCGPTDYKLRNDALKQDAPGHWVSEHILELQAFPRFLEAAASGLFLIPLQLQRPTQPSTFPITKAGNDPVYPGMTRNNMPGWNQPDTPATVAMAWLGSTLHADTMVVCESSLNAIKSRIFRFFRPVSDRAWASRCSALTQVSAENMFSVIQRVFGLFDYYEDANVKAKHKRAYDGVKEVLRQYELTDPRLNNQQLQKAWKEYCTKQARTMGEFAKWWILEKLQLQRTAWDHELQRLLLTTGGFTGPTLAASMTVAALDAFLQKAALHFNIDVNIYS